MLRNEHQVAGRRLPRLDGAAKASGRHVYGADFALPGMLYGKILRSRVPRARLVRIDTRRAAALAGVRAVITAADVPEVRYGNAVKDLTVFATDEIRFVGHPLAAVAATTLETADEALALIEVELEPLEPGDDPERAPPPARGGRGRAGGPRRGGVAFDRSRAGAARAGVRPRARARTRRAAAAPG